MKKRVRKEERKVVEAPYAITNLEEFCKAFFNNHCKKYVTPNTKLSDITVYSRISLETIGVSSNEVSPADVFLVEWKPNKKLIYFHEFVSGLSSTGWISSVHKGDIETMRTITHIFNEVIANLK